MSIIKYESIFNVNLDVDYRRDNVTVTLTLIPENKVALDICSKAETNMVALNDQFPGFIGEIELRENGKYYDSGLVLEIDEIEHDVQRDSSTKELSIKLTAPVQDRDDDDDYGFNEGDIWIDPSNGEERMIISTTDKKKKDADIITLDLDETYFDEKLKKTRKLDRKILQLLIKMKIHVWRNVTTEII